MAVGGMDAPGPSWLIHRGEFTHKVVTCQP